METPILVPVHNTHNQEQCNFFFPQNILNSQLVESPDAERGIQRTDCHTIAVGLGLSAESPCSVRQMVGLMISQGLAQSWNPMFLIHEEESRIHDQPDHKR